MPRIVVTVADSADDRDRAMAIWRAANRTRRRPWGETHSKRVQERINAAQLLLLARYGDEPAGMLMAETFSSDGHTDPEVGHIAMVNVEPRRWGSGIGTALVRDLQTNHWSALSAWIRDDNRRAERLLLTTGFAATGNRAHLQDGEIIYQLTWSSTPER